MLMQELLSALSKLWLRVLQVSSCHSGELLRVEGDSFWLRALRHCGDGCPRVESLPDQATFRLLSREICLLTIVVHQSRLSNLQEPLTDMSSLYS
jgi:hypothetical protein